MSKARISILGLYTWDNSLFDDFKLPSSVNKETLINNLLMECGELEVLYPDYDFMKNAIKFWSQKEFNKWNNIQEILNKSYDFLTDYNRIETYNDSENRNLEQTETGTDTTKGTSINSVNGWNSEDYSNKNKITDENVRTPNLKNTDSGTITKNGTKEISGSNGKFSKQELLIQELRFREFNNLDDIIIDDFKTQFCLLIY